MSTDRREPEARYVQFADDATQAQFVRMAEADHQALLKADQWGASLPVATGPDTIVSERRGLLRRLTEVTVPAPTALVTPALAAADRAGSEIPQRVAGLGGCAAEAALAAAAGEVVLDLVRYLAGLPVSQQQAHPAYRQTVRLAAELEALHEVLAKVGCGEGSGCVRARAPMHWGRRAEDVEVAEVRAVLVRLAETAGTVEHNDRPSR